MPASLTTSSGNRNQPRHDVVDLHRQRARTGRKDFDALGMIPTDNLNPQKSRILLMPALTKIRDPREISRIFPEY